MRILGFGGNQLAAAGGYEVDNSLRFDDGSSDNLSITPASNGNDRTGTFSWWFKRGDTGATKYFYGQTISGSGVGVGILLSSDKIYIFQYDGTSPFNPANYDFGLTSQAVFRDHSAWYHAVLSIDTDNSTQADRIKLYVNGVSQTLESAGSQGFPAQNLDTAFFQSATARIGSDASGGNNFDGYIAEFVGIDGTALDPTSFGEFDSATGIWKPIDVSSLTFGTNGFYLDFENSGSLGADVSGNGNNFTVNNLTSIDQSTDTCTNNFATMNPLNVPTSNAPTFAEGNLETESATTSGQRFMGSSTIGLTDGKWYAECKIVVIDSATVGVSPDVQAHALDNTYIGSHQYDYSILPDSGAKYNNDNGTTHGDAFSTNDILMIALDLDNNNVYFGRNGNWFDGSGNANQSSPSSALSLTDPPSTPDGAYFFASSDGGGSAKAKVQWNFGSPPFSISSGNSDGNGYGNFEYAVPSGYYSLNSKNLAEYG